MNLDQFKLNGKYLMLALDHRGSMKKLMNPQDPESVSDQSVIQLKSEIIETLKDQFSGLLIDETFGLDAYPQHQKPFLLPMEKSGFTEKNGERFNELEYTLPMIAQEGATGAKLLIYFNPKLESAQLQLGTAKIVVDECKLKDFPLFLEIVTYAPPGQSEDRASLVLESLKMFLQYQVVPDVFKLEYPGSPEACSQVTSLLGATPWILLTRGVNYDEFKEEYKVALSVGCQGFLAGRALWQEVCTLKDLEKEQFLKVTLPERFRELATLS